MSEYSTEQIKRFLGSITIKNVSGAVLDLTGYGQYSFATDEEIDLLDPATPDTLRAGDFNTACNMLGRAKVGTKPQYTDYELAQLIQDDKLAVTAITKPDMGVLDEELEG